MFRLPVRRLNGKISASQRNLDEATHFLEFFFFDPTEGVKIFYFAGDAAVKTGGVKTGDAGNAAFSRNQVFPAFFRADS